MSKDGIGEHKESYNCPPPKSSSQLSSIMNQPLLSKDNPIQLAAISNYKLAQLTFSAPDLNSMRKTALIKNMAEVIYTDTPPEWLDQMRRWQFFTPESLNDMTQDGLEQIFGQYIQTMEAFKPINLNDEEDDDDDDDDDEFWADEEILTPSDNQLNLADHTAPSPSTVPAIMEYPLYAHSGASMSGDLLYQKDIKPLPERPIIFTGPSATTTTVTPNNSTTDGPTSTTSDDKHRRKSLAQMRNRLSWTSDTGLSANSAVAQTWANELMTMFNMEFQVDTSLTLNTAPKLPELPFSSRHNQHKRRSRRSQRYSTDSFMNLIPAFESFDLEEPERRSSLGYRSRNMTFPPPPLSTPPPSHETPGFSPSRRRSSSQPVPMDTYQRSEAKPGPTRSSSLKYKSQATKSHETAPTPKHKSTDIINGLVNAFNGVTGEKSLSKKKSIRRLTALVTGASSNDNHNNSTNSIVNHQSQSSSSLSPRPSVNRSSTSSTLYQPPLSPTQQSGSLSATYSASRLSIASTTSTASSTNSVVMVATKTPLVQHKPLPSTPSSGSNNRHTEIKRRTSYAMARPMVVEVSELRRSRSVGYRPKKKRKSLKTTASMKRKSGPLVKTASSRSMNDIYDHNDTTATATTGSTLCASPSELIHPIPPSPSLPILQPPSTSYNSKSYTTVNDQLSTDTTSPANPAMTLSSSTSTSASSISALSSSSQPSLASVSTPPSAMLTPPQPKRSKSALMKLGSGLTKGHKKAQRKDSSSSSSSPMPDMETELAEVNFVKRMASLGKRMKLQRV